MKERTHRYETVLEWTGNTGAGTAHYRAYERSHEIGTPGGAKSAIPGSSDPAFRGDRARWNPEELLVASLSSCHQLWYLHLCADAGIVVTRYADRAEGEMVEGADGGGRFTGVTLRPEVTLAAGGDPGDVARALALHDRAHALCFIANSVRFPVRHEPVVRVDAQPAE